MIRLRVRNSWRDHITMAVAVVGVLTFGMWLFFLTQVKVVHKDADYLDGGMRRWFDNELGVVCYSDGVDLSCLKVPE